MNLNPQENSTVELQNASWLFMIAVLRQQQAGVFADNGQEGLLGILNNKLVEANSPKEPSD